MYEVRILDSARDNLAKLDQSTARRIVNRIRWFSENFEHVKHELLKGDLLGLYKLRVGDYRVLYEVLKDEKLIIIHQIGHRRDIYRRD